MVKASELIEEIENGDYEAEITDSGDCNPYLQSISISTDEDYKCSITGNLAYPEDDAKYGTDSGASEVVIMGVTFSNNLMYADDITIDGDIEYDDDLEESDVIQAAEEYIKWPCSDGEESEFDEDSVDSDEIYNLLCESDLEYFVFALNKANEVCAFQMEDLELDFEEDCFEYLSQEEKELVFAKLTEKGFEYIELDEAYKRLAEDKPDFECDTCYKKIPNKLVGNYKYKLYNLLTFTNYNCFLTKQSINSVNYS